MRTLAIRGVLIAGVVCGAVCAQAVEVSLVVAGGSTSIPPGGGTYGEITIDVFVDDVVSPDALRSYQVTLEVVPQPGATGSVTLVDPVTLWPDNESIFVDTSRTDWVFYGESGFFEGTNPLSMQIGAALISTTVEVTQPKYCGTYVFHASANASGDFQIKVVVAESPTADVQPTQLRDEFLMLWPIDLSPLDGIMVTVTDTVINDNCASALPVTDGVTLFSTDTADTDGPSHPGSGCDQAGTDTISNDVWYDYTATCSGVMTASTCGAANFDTRVAIYSTCTCPVTDTDLLLCNDNDIDCSGLTSEAVVATGIFEGVCYKIRVGATGDLTGSGSLKVTCAPDQCPYAKQVSPSSSTPGSTDNTVVNDSIGPNCGEGPVDSPGVWYTVTGTGDLMRASVSGASYDTRLTVYQGGCASLSCVGDANNAGSGGEQVSWCSTFGTAYLILVHGSGGTTGEFTLNMTNTSCNDSNACTDDACVAGACVNAINYNDAVYCCAPSTGNLTVIDDDNPCTDDICHANGSVTHPAVSDGPNSGCDDSLVCTLDECFSGACVNTDINTISCQGDNDCPGDYTCGDEVPGFCFCDSGPMLELIPDPGTLPVEGCYDAGETIDIRVEMGVAEVPIVGAQFFLEYDASTLTFLSIEPGGMVDPSSPFSMEFNETVDPGLGTIDYLVGVDFGSSTMGLTTVAVITFEVFAECDAFLRYRPAGPHGEPNRFTDTSGTEVLPNLVHMTPILINGSPPMLGACPADVATPPDPGLLTASIPWVNPSATDSCDGLSVPVICNPPSGSAFSPGTTSVVCTATNSCGMQDTCSFSVRVDAQVVTVDVELGSVDPGPFERCITFEVWDCDGPPGAQHVSVSQTLTFANGLAQGVDVLIPGGDWECMTARDELHTLRSTAPDFSTTDGIQYTASFVGSRAAGGHWLVGGNLNDDEFIDILDFGILSSQHMTQATPDTPCGTPPPDANINGDDQVSLLDLVVFVGNSLEASEPDCCGAGSTAAASGPIEAISVRDLRRLGLGHLATGDINRDGMLDMDDVLMLLDGTEPSAGVGNDCGKSTRRRIPGR